MKLNDTTPPQAYSRPPILEAVIGITFAEPIKDSALATVDRRFAKHYPVHQDKNGVHLAFKFQLANGAGELPAPSAERTVIHGHHRTNPGMDEIAVLQPDSLTVSQLAPYKGWEAFIARFKRDLQLYKKLGPYRTISRIGVRYINRVDIPVGGDVVEFERYLNLHPRVPDALGPIVGYAMQTTFEIAEIGCLATLNSATVPSPTLRHASFMVDIDIYKTANLPMNDAGVLELLGRIRAEKNRIFEACITKPAREEIFGHANP